MRKLITIAIIALSVNAFAQIPTDSLSLWLSSDYGITASNSDVLQWDDRSGHMRNAIATLGNPQFIQNEICGNPVVRFNGASNGMTIPAFETFSNKRGAIIVVGRVNGNGNGAGGYGTFVSTWVGSGVTWQFCSNLGTYSWFDGVGGSATPITSSPPNQWGILTLNRQDDDTLQFYKSGVLVQKHVIANNQPSINNLYIGYSSSFEVLNGDIAEIIIYNKSLTVSEIYQVNTYLANKYSFNSSIAQPISNNQSSCMPTSFTLIATGGVQYKWYDDMYSTTPLCTNAVFNTPFLTATDTFYVANYNDTLESVRTMVIATIHPSPLVTLALINDTICINNGTILLTGGFPIGGTYSGIGVISDSFDPNIAGVGLSNIIYTYTDSNGCTSSDTSQIVIDLCSQTNPYQSTQSIEIYPNPSNGNITIRFECNSSFANSYTLRIINSLSQIIYSTSINTKQTTVDFSTWAEKGIYFYQLINDKCIIKTGKLIVE